VPSPDDVPSATKTTTTLLMERNVHALALLLSGRPPHEAVAVQRAVVDGFTQQLGTTSDSFVDIAGAINDLALCHLADGDCEASEKQLKRALLMANRSYRVSHDLLAAVTSNLSLVCERVGRTDDALKHADAVLRIARAHAQPLSPPLLQGAQAAVPVPPWRQQHAHAVATVAATAAAAPSPNNSSTSSPSHWATVELPAFRRAQTLLLAGTCIGRLRHPEEGLIHINSAIALLTPAAAGDATTVAWPLALRHLAAAHEHCEGQRRTRICAGHIQVDHLSNLTRAELSLAAPTARLLDAADAAAASSADVLRHYQRVGVFGVALLDVDAHT
jgi:tetratricopeptide (TPR) repeat protein